MRNMSEANFADKTVWTGDNLDILRGMNSACVDLIYLDPPFNSNQDYAAPVGSQAAGAAFKDTCPFGPRRGVDGADRRRTAGSASSSIGCEGSSRQGDVIVPVHDGGQVDGDAAGVEANR